MPKIENHSIRGLDYYLYIAARLTALSQRITVGELINRAIASYLKDPGDQEDHHIAASIRDYWKQKNGGS